MSDGPSRHLSCDAPTPYIPPSPAYGPPPRPLWLGRGPCSYPRCHGGGGFRPCTGFTGTGEDCLNCGHDYSYHA